MLKLKEVIRILQNSLEDLRVLSEPQEFKKEVLEGTLKKYSFIREFCKLGERLIYFRGVKFHAPDSQTREIWLANEKAQLDATQPISELQDKNGYSVVTGFTSRRNKFIHSHPLQSYFNNESLYEGAIIYLKDNLGMLEQALNKIG